MLLRDVVWLGIASKLSLLSPYTTLLRDVVLARHSELALSALTLYNIEVFFIPFWVHHTSNLRSGARAKALWKDEPERGHLSTISKCKDNAE